ncbi:retrovirus-related pol polyprotein from transposon TNT 1-94 [Tanacetum coccineum]
MDLGYQNPFYLKQAQQKQKSLYNGKVLLDKHDPPAVYDSEERPQLAQESRLKMKQLNKEIKPTNYEKINKLYEVFVSQTAKSREEVKDTIATLQGVVKPRILLNVNNWSFPVHQEVHKILKDESAPVVNQADVRVIHFEMQFLKEASNFIQDFKSLTKEANEYLDKITVLEKESEHLLRAVVSQDILSIMQNSFVIDTSDLQPNVRKKSLNPVSLKRILNMLNFRMTGTKNVKNANMTRLRTIKLTMTCNVKSNGCKLNWEISRIRLRAQLFGKFSEQNDTVKGTSANTKFAKPSILGKPPSQPFRNQSVVRQPIAFQSERAKFSKTRYIPKVDVNNDLTKPVTSHSISDTQESKVVKNDKLIAPGIFRINTLQNSRVDKVVPNKPVKASVRTKPITVSQPHVNTKKDVNSDSNGLSSTRNKEVEVEDHIRNLLLSKNQNHVSSECNNIKLAIHNDKSEVVCAMLNLSVILTFLKVVKICLWCVDSGCSKNMIGNLKLLINFIWKFMGTVRFGNDHVAAILGHGDLQWGNILIARVYFVEGLGYNLFSVGQNLEGVDLLKGNRTTNLYTINLCEMTFASPICLMARATSTKPLLWHQCLSHLNFDTINELAKNDLVTGLPKLKYIKEHLCPSYQKYEEPEEIKTFLKKIHVLLQALIIIVRTENGTEFTNQVLKEYFDDVGISHQTSSVKTPQQNGVVERRNQTLVEAARTMLIFSCAPVFLWAEAIATACYTQNHSLIHQRIDKTPYELINDIKPDITFLHVFGALCYPKNDCEDIGKLGAKGDIGFFIGYSATSCAYKFKTRSLRTRSYIYAPSTITSQKPIEHELDLVFEAMYDDYIGGQPSDAPRTSPAAPTT